MVLKADFPRAQFLPMKSNRDKWPTKLFQWLLMVKELKRTKFLKTIAKFTTLLTVLATKTFATKTNKETKSSVQKMR